MPGVKSIVWSDANDSKMLRALLVCGNIQISPQIAEQVAAYMGPGVPGRAILSHMMLTKKKYKDEIARGASSTTATPMLTKRTAPTKAFKASKKPKQAVKTEVDSDAEDENDEGESPATPPDTPAGKNYSTGTSKDVTPTPTDKSRGSSQASIASKRSSPRCARSVDYSKLHDPFVSMEGVTDEDGHNVFGDDDGQSSEDSADSDEGFTGGKAGLEMEEEETEV
ncbi:hypothetical protein MMC18_000054 [Xylographa bjoerkii]|nr:hypothetical protein [Xylographa bjoerkii]